MEYELNRIVNLPDFDEYGAEVVIISGGARGADTLAERYAKEANYKLEVFKADWTKHGKQAGFIRNGYIITAADAVVAFWDGTSRGTLDTINKAKALNLPLFICNY